MTWEDDISLRFHRVYEGEPFWLNEADWQKQISEGKVRIWDVK